MTRQQQRTISESSSTSESSTDIEAFLLKKEHFSRAGQRSCSVSSRSMAVASLVISILCLLIVLGCGCWVFVFGKEKFWDPTSKVTSEKVCLPCIQVNPHHLGEAQMSFADGLEVRHDAGSDVKLCCANSVAQYAVLFKLFLQKQQEVMKLADILGSTNNSVQVPKINGSVASAHLLFKPQTEEHIDSEDTLQWNSPQDSSVAHVRGGLKFVDNTIYILTPGLYFVYCQILYNRVDPETEQGGQIASSYVMRHSIAYPPTSGILLKSRHTRYSREADRHSSYVGGLFFLHAGDQLSVQASKKSIISNDETASFFGLFKIGV